MHESYSVSTGLNQFLLREKKTRVICDQALSHFANNFDVPATEGQCRAITHLFLENSKVNRYRK